MIQYIKKPLFCGFFCFILFVHGSWAQFQPGTYAVYYTDKIGCESVANDSWQYLSARSLARRAKHRSSIGCEDIPVNPYYITTTQELVSHPAIVTSKWLNTSVFLITEENSYRVVKALPFVDSLQLLERSLATMPVMKSGSVGKFEAELLDEGVLPSSTTALSMINAEFLNRQGFFGENVLVAVFDGGFVSANKSSAFTSLFESGRVIQTHDFIEPDSNVFRSALHGTAVWGLIAGVGPEAPIGAASKASYCLYRTEDVVHESRIEEFYWAAAMERADSLGVDVVNSSLGYNVFDDSLTNYTYANFEGTSSIVSRIAKMAWERGVLVVNSAGNEGSRPWHYTIFPAEVPEILTVGSVNSLQYPSYFTSHGFSGSSGIKPDVAALGETVVSVLADGTIGVIGNGTSFAAPAVAGGVACLIGAFPTATNDEIKTAILQSSNLDSEPNLLSGHGVPDFRKAFLILQNSQIQQPNAFVLLPNPACSYASVLYRGVRNQNASLELRTRLGELVYRIDIVESGSIEEIVLPLSALEIVSGLYFISVQTSEWRKTTPLIIE